MLGLRCGRCTGLSLTEPACGLSGPELVWPCSEGPTLGRHSPTFPTVATFPTSPLRGPAVLMAAVGWNPPAGSSACSGLFLADTGQKSHLGSTPYAHPLVFLPDLFGPTLNFQPFEQPGLGPHSVPCGFSPDRVGLRATACSLGWGPPLRMSAARSSQLTSLCAHRAQALSSPGLELEQCGEQHEQTRERPGHEGVNKAAEPSQSACSSGGPASWGTRLRPAASTPGEVGRAHSGNHPSRPVWLTSCPRHQLVLDTGVHCHFS